MTDNGKPINVFATVLPIIRSGSAWLRQQSFPLKVAHRLYLTPCRGGELPGF